MGADEDNTDETDKYYFNSALRRFVPKTQTGIVVPAQKSKPLMSAGEFYSNTKILGALNKVSVNLKELNTAQLKDQLAAIHTKPINKFRALLLSISFELSDRGIAPRWQGILDAADTNDQHRVVNPSKHSDAIIIDLYCLAREFPKHRTGNKRWNGLFESAFNLELAASIADRRINLCLKVYDMRLSNYQETGCIALYSNATKQIRTAAKSASEDGRIKCSNYRNGKSPEEITAHRRIVIYCAKLANCSPQKTANVYRWVTGDFMSRQNASKLIKHYKIKPSRIAADG